MWVQRRVDEFKDVRGSAVSMSLRTWESVTWLFHTCERGGEAKVNECAIQVCDMTRSYVWQIRLFVRDRDGETESYESGIHVCDMTHSYVWYHTYECVMSLCIHVRDMTHSYVWHIWMRSYVWYHTYERIHQYKLMTDAHSLDTGGYDE